jgi:hypothetical protein
MNALRTGDNYRTLRQQSRQKLRNRDFISEVELGVRPPCFAFMSGLTSELAHSDGLRSPDSRVEGGLEARARTLEWKPEPYTTETRAVTPPQMSAAALALWTRLKRLFRLRPNAEANRQDLGLRDGLKELVPQCEAEENLTRNAQLES